VAAVAAMRTPLPFNPTGMSVEVRAGFWRPIRVRSGVYGKHLISVIAGKGPVDGRHPDLAVFRGWTAAEDGLPVLSFRSLLADLAALARNTITPAVTPNYPLTVVTRPTQIQQKAFNLLASSVAVAQRPADRLFLQFNRLRVYRSEISD